MGNKKLYIKFGRILVAFVMLITGLSLGELGRQGTEIVNAADYTGKNSWELVATTSTWTNAGTDYEWTPYPGLDKRDNMIKFKGMAVPYDSRYVYRAEKAGMPGNSGIYSHEDIHAFEYGGGSASNYEYSTQYQVSYGTTEWRIYRKLPDAEYSSYRLYTYNQQYVEGLVFDTYPTAFDAGFNSSSGWSNWWYDPNNPGNDNISLGGTFGPVSSTNQLAYFYDNYNEFSYKYQWTPYGVVTFSGRRGATAKYTPQNYVETVNLSKAYIDKNGIFTRYPGTWISSQYYTVKGSMTVSRFAKYSLVDKGYKEVEEPYEPSTASYYASPFGYTFGSIQAVWGGQSYTLGSDGYYYYTGGPINKALDSVYVMANYNAPEHKFDRVIEHWGSGTYGETQQYRYKFSKTRIPLYEPGTLLDNNIYAYDGDYPDYGEKGGYFYIRLPSTTPVPMVYGKYIAVTNVSESAWSPETTTVPAAYGVTGYTGSFGSWTGYKVDYETGTYYHDKTTQPLNYYSQVNYRFGQYFYYVNPENRTEVYRFRLSQNPSTYAVEVYFSKRTITTSLGVGAKVATVETYDGVYPTDGKFVDGYYYKKEGPPDNVPPTITVTPQTTAWSSSAYLLTISASDPSGVASLEVQRPDGSWTSIANGAQVWAWTNGVYTVRAADGRGNTGSQTYNVTNLDLTAPTLNLSSSPTYGTPTSGISITWSASDGQSGVNRVTNPSGSTSINATGSYNVFSNGTYTFSVTDKAGNNTSKSITITGIDGTAPQAIIETDPAAYTNGNVSVVVKSWDNLSGSTVTSSQLTRVSEVAGSFNNSSGISVNGMISRFTATANGTYNFRVTDGAGNNYNTSYSVTNIDRVPPTITATPWVTVPTQGDVFITLDMSDSLSGVKGVTMPDGSFVAVSPPSTSATYRATQNGTYSFIAQDNAGNTASTTYVVSNIDRTPPSLLSVRLISNGSNPLYAKYGDDYIIIAKFDEPILTTSGSGKLSIGTNRTKFTPYGSEPNTYSMNGYFYEGYPDTLVSQINSISNIGDLAGNYSSWLNVATTDGSYVQYYGQKPTATIKSITSTKGNPGYAIESSLITINWESTQHLNVLPTVNVENRLASTSLIKEAKGGPASYVTTITIKKDDPQGKLLYSISDLINKAGGQ